MSEQLQAKIDAVVRRYKPELDQLQAEGERLGEDAMDPNTAEAVINVDFDMTWKDHEIVFDLPSVTMKHREIALDLPEVTMKRERIVFDKPVTRMERRCLFKKPVFRWPDVKMECVYGNVPVVTMEKHEIIFDVPEVRMDRKDMSFDVPEFTMKRQRWVVKLPEFTVTNIKAGARRLQDKGEELQRRGEEIGRRMEQELKLVLMGGAEAGDNASREAVLAKYDAAISNVERSIATLTAQQIDPIKVPAESGDVNLRKELASLMAERDAALAAIDGMFDDSVEAEPIAA